MCGRGIEQDTCSEAAGGHGRRRDDCHGDLELHDEHIARLKPGHRALDIERVEPAVGAWRDGDHVLTLRADKDQCGAGGGRIIPLDAGCVHAVGREIRDEFCTKVIGAHPANHADLATEAGRGDGLVRALAPRVAAEAIAQNRLAGPRQVRDFHDQVHVQAAQHKNSGRRFDRWQGLCLSVGLAVGRGGHGAPHGTGDDDDGQ